MVLVTVIGARDKPWGRILGGADRVFGAGGGERRGGLRRASGESLQDGRVRNNGRSLRSDSRSEIEVKKDS